MSSLARAIDAARSAAREALAPRSPTGPAPRSPAPRSPTGPAPRSPVPRLPLGSRPAPVPRLPTGPVPRLPPAEPVPRSLAGPFPRLLTGPLPRSLIGPLPRSLTAEPTPRSSTAEPTPRLSTAEPTPRRPPVSTQRRSPSPPASPPASSLIPLRRAGNSPVKQRPQRTFRSVLGLGTFKRRLDLAERQALSVSQSPEKRARLEEPSERQTTPETPGSRARCSNSPEY